MYKFLIALLLCSSPVYADSLHGWAETSTNRPDGRKNAYVLYLQVRDHNVTKMVEGPAYVSVGTRKSTCSMFPVRPGLYRAVFALHDGRPRVGQKIRVRVEVDGVFIEETFTASAREFTCGY